MPLDPNLPGPVFVQLFQPVLDALAELGGSGRPSEVCDAVAASLQISGEDRAETLSSGNSRFDNKVAWARFYLAKSGHIDSSRRGIWTLSDHGLNASRMNHDDALELFQAVQAEFSKKSVDDDRTSEPDTADEEAPSPDPSDSGRIEYRAELMEILLSLPADGFERFCQRLLRESGFQEVSVTGKSGDGGIDGIGVLQVNPLVSFKVLFQCKRYKGSVGAPVIRDFRGAMMGRADKGIVLTTGAFTTDARKEAVRDGVPPIELVDGDALIRMLEELELGLEAIQTYRVEARFFDTFR